ncbi:MAG: sugar ABC transporter permease [Chloroflexota bacterium]|nr:sugar ABC transporter permease [Chloroflexota bacterium]
MANEAISRTDRSARTAHPSRRLGLSEAWQRRSFLLPAVVVTLAIVIFPTVFGIYVSFTDWQLNDPTGLSFNGLDNFRAIARDGRFWNALGNNFLFVGLGVPFQYGVALGLALLLNQEIRGRKFFRVIFLLPFMMSPVAAGWMIGRSIMDAQRGPLPDLLQRLGFGSVSFFENGPRAVLSLLLIDSWYSIPFMLVMLLAGLQALPPEVMEAARIDGASRWHTFRDMTFPLLLPVSLTAVVLRVVFEFKVIDIILVVTGGGPGNATETLTAYIYKRGVQNVDVGYATAMSQLFLLAVIVTVTAILLTAGRKVREVV